jgi:hypothetical protein
MWLTGPITTVRDEHISLKALSVDKAGLSALKWFTESRRSGAVVLGNHPITSYSNAHNAEAAVALYERAEDGLRCCHDFALNNSEIRSRLLQIALDHGMVP